MKKHPLLNVSSVLGIIIGSCSFFLSFPYMSHSSYYSVLVFRYFASLEFFISIATIIMSAILLGKNKKLIEYDTLKIYGILNIIFVFILLLLQFSSLSVCDFTNDEFEITFVMVTSIVTIITLVLLIYGIIKSNKDEKPEIKKQLSDLKELLDKGLITQEEFDAKRKDLIERI